MKDRGTLLRKIGAASFGMTDIQLYLDTHPNDTKALALYDNYREKYVTLVGEFGRKYGPLTAINGDYGGRWQWVDDPWPWEYEANEGADKYVEL